ncbi:MAG: hypothetical protein PHG82_02890 [Candidatus Gracilibacteria bacterium]|nr:hypothetical protein [Candidatus Gracilibacteria bacterium]
MNILQKFLEGIGLNLYGAENPNMVQNQISKDYHIFLMADVISTSRESTAVLVIEEGTDMWEKINSPIKDFSQIAKFLFGIGINLYDENSPSVQLIESLENGKSRFDYHIFNYVVSRGRSIAGQQNKKQLENEIKKKQKPFLIIYEGTKHWYKIKHYFDTIMYASLMNEKKIPFSCATL